jgi:hypothetical protein
MNTTISTQQFTTLSEIDSRASDSKAVLFDLRSAKNTLSGKDKFAFRDTMFNASARVLVSKRTPVALAWTVDDVTSSVVITHLHGQAAIAAHLASANLIPA